MIGDDIAQDMLRQCFTILAVSHCRMQASKERSERRQQIYSAAINDNKRTNAVQYAKAGRDMQHSQNNMRRSYADPSPNPRSSTYTLKVRAVSLILNLAVLSVGHSNLTHSRVAAVVIRAE